MSFVWWTLHTLSIEFSVSVDHDGDEVEKHDAKCAQVGDFQGVPVTQLQSHDLGILAPNQDESVLDDGYQHRDLDQDEPLVDVAVPDASGNIEWLVVVDQEEVQGDQDA